MKSQMSKDIVDDDNGKIEEYDSSINHQLLKLVNKLRDEIKENTNSLASVHTKILDLQKEVHQLKMQNTLPSGENSARSSSSTLSTHSSSRKRRVINLNEFEVEDDKFTAYLSQLSSNILVNAITIDIKYSKYPLISQIR